MTDTPRRTGTPTPVSAGIDAFRRRQQLPSRPGVSRALDGLTASVDPSVVLAGVARLSVSIGFADGCEIELTDGDRPLFRTATESADVEPTSDGADGWRTLATPLHCPSRGRFESFSGVVVHRWRRHEPDEDDRLLADVLVRHAVSVVDRERLVHMVAEREERSSQLTMQAITGRWTHIATGLIMGQFGVDVADAEDVLRDAARRRGISTWDLALEVVHSRGLLDRTGPSAAMSRRTPLRSVRPDAAAPAVRSTEPGE